MVNILDVTKIIQKKYFVNVVVETNGLKNQRSWLNKNDALFVDLMNEEIANGN